MFPRPLSHPFISAESDTIYLGTTSGAPTASTSYDLGVVPCFVVLAVTHHRSFATQSFTAMTIDGSSCTMVKTADDSSAACVGYINALKSGVITVSATVSASASSIDISTYAVTGLSSLSPYDSVIMERTTPDPITGMLDIPDGGVLISAFTDEKASATPPTEVVVTGVDVTDYSAKSGFRGAHTASHSSPTVAEGNHVVSATSPENPLWGVAVSWL